MEQLLPNYFADGMRAASAGKAERDRNAFRQIASQAVGAQGDARAPLIQQAVAIDPEAGMALGKNLDAQDDGLTSKAAGAARYVLNAVETKNPAAVQGAYQAVRPFLARIGAAHGKVPPDQWSDDMLPMLHQVVAAAGGTSGKIFAQKVGEDGFIYNAMADGSMVNTGVRADPRTQLRDQPGIDPSIVDLRSGTARPLTPAGAAPQAPGAMRSGPVTFTDTDGRPAVIDDPSSMPPAVVSQLTGQPAAAPMPAPPGVVAARPAVAPAEAERLRLAQEANQRAAEAAARAEQSAAETRAREARGSAPAGMRFRPDGSLEPIPGAPVPAGVGGSEDERKAAGWYAQASKAFADMNSAVSEDPHAAEPGFVESYSPSDELANRSRSPTRQRFAQAASAFGEAVLRAATGAGVNESEARQKVAELTPQRGDSQAVRDQKMASMTMYLNSLHTRAGRALSPTNNGSGPGPNRRAGDAPHRVTNAADYSALPSGATFIAPDGSVRRKK